MKGRPRTKEENAGAARLRGPRANCAASACHAPEKGRGLSALLHGRAPTGPTVAASQGRVELPPMAATNKCLAPISKTGAGVRATKGHQPEGDLGEAKNKHLLPPPRSEEAEIIRS